MAKNKKSHTRHGRAGDRRLGDALDQAYALMAHHRWSEARTLLQDLDRVYPQRQPILRALVEVAVALQDAHLYQYGCERLFTLRPHDSDLPYMLSRAYTLNGWLALALSMGRQALALDPLHEKAKETRR